MKLSFQVLLFFILVIAAGCADPGFMDKTKMDGSILQGHPLLPTDELQGRAVFIAKNFSATQSSEENRVNVIKFGICTGVILDANHILTAAHCAGNSKTSRVILTDDVNKPVKLNQIYEIEKATLHPLYEKNLALEKKNRIPPGPTNLSKRYDLAILNLDRPIPLRTDLNFLLSISAKIKPSETLSAQVTGFGRITDLNNSQSTEYEFLNGKLLKAQVELLTTQLAKPIIMLNQRGTSGVCLGDSGAPLFIEHENKLYLQALAIATYKINSEDSENKYNQCYGNALYLNLDMHKKWIQKNLNL